MDTCSHYTIIDDFMIYCNNNTELTCDNCNLKTCDNCMVNKCPKCGNHVWCKYCFKIKLCKECKNK